MIAEAQNYLPRTKRITDRPIDGNHAVRPRKTLVEIYTKFAADERLKDVLDRKYPVYIPKKRAETDRKETETQNVKSFAEEKGKGKASIKKKQGQYDDFNEDNYKREKLVPDTFKRDFFRLIKLLSSTKTKTITVNELKKGSHRLPTTFMVAGNAGSHNKKILMTKQLAHVAQSVIKKENRATHSAATRIRAFYRDDTLQHRQQVFMTLDE